MWAIALILVLGIPTGLLLIVVVPPARHQQKMAALEYRAERLKIEEREAILMEKLISGRGLREILPPSGSRSNRELEA